MRLLGVLVSALLWTAVYAIPVDGGGNGKPVGKPGPGGGSGGMDNLEIDLNLNPYLPSFLKCLEDTEVESRKIPLTTARHSFLIEGHNGCVNDLIKQVEQALMAALPADASDFAKDAVPQLARTAVIGWLRGDSENNIVEFSIAPRPPKGSNLLKSVSDATRGIRDGVQETFFPKERPYRDSPAFDGYRGPGASFRGRPMIRGRPL